MESHSKDFKIAIVGDGAVGKSTLIHRLLHNEFINQKITTGLKTQLYTIKIGDINVNLLLWDLGGQRQFQSLHHSYLKGSKGIIYTYDVTRINSFENLGFWTDLVNKNAPNNHIKILLGTKLDLQRSNPVISEDIISEFCKEQQIIKHILTSAKLGINIKEPFQLLAEKLLNSID